jgi:hypothetical protein
MIGYSGWDYVVKALLPILLGGLLLAFDFSSADAAKVQTTRVLPSFAAQSQYDDNIYAEETNEQGSFIRLLQPALQFSFDNGLSQAFANYRGELASYEASPDDDYFDQRIGLGGRHAFRRWAQLGVGLNADRLHEARGTGLTQGLATSLNTPDEYELNKLSLVFDLGTRRSQGKFEVELNSTTKRYSTRPTATAERNRNKQHLRLAYHINLSAKTSILAETHYRVIDYVSEAAVASSRDSVEQNHVLGISLDITELSKGSAKFGQQTKAFSDDARTDGKIASWEFSLDWKATPITRIQLSSQGTQEESVGEGGYINRRSVYFMLRNATTRQVNTEMSFNIAKNTYMPAG